MKKVKDVQSIAGCERNGFSISIKWFTFGGVQRYSIGKWRVCLE